MIQYKIEENKKLKLYEKLFVGFRKQSGSVNLGFMTPYETNAAGTNRQNTVKSWSDKKTPTEIYENVPVEGFIITDDIKRIYYGGGNVVWRIYDPRGFELEISSNNLFTIIQNIGVGKGGLIPGKCIWGRDGSENILLHETSDEYKNSIKIGTDSAQQSASVVKTPGNYYIMKDGTEAIFLGRKYVYTTTSDKLDGTSKPAYWESFYGGGWDASRSAFDKLLVANKYLLTFNQSKFYIEKPTLYDLVMTDDNVVTLYKTANFLTEVNGKSITPPSDDEINKMSVFFYSYTNKSSIMLVSTNKLKTPIFSLTELNSVPKQITEAIHSQKTTIGYPSEYTYNLTRVFNQSYMLFKDKNFFEYNGEKFCEINIVTANDKIHTIYLTKFDGILDGANSFNALHSTGQVIFNGTNSYLKRLDEGGRFPLATEVRNVYSGNISQVLDFLDEFSKEVTWYSIGVKDNG